MDALVIIDVQQGMFGVPEFKVHDPDGTVGRIRDLLDAARAKDSPVIFVQHDGGAGHPLAAGEPGFAFVAPLAPRLTETVVVKTNCNAFQGTDLDAIMRAAGIDHLIVCGMQTQYCVDTAVRAAVERGYRVSLVADGHTTGDTPALSGEAIIGHHNETLNGSFAAVRPAAMISFG